MSTSVGASDRSQADDSVLATALSEMSSEGSIQADASIADLAETKPDASQTAGSAGAGSPAAAPPTPGDDGAVPPVAAAPKADDPLAGTEPFTYGEGKTLDGVYRVPGEGLLVPESHVAAFTAVAERAAKADQLEQAHRDLSTNHAAFERAASWTVTDEQGKETTLTGLNGLEAMRVAYGQQSAALDTLASIFHPDKSGNYPRLFALLTTEQIPDGRGGTVERLVPNPDALNNLLTQSELAEMRAEQTARSQLATLTKPEPQAPTPPNFTVEAPKLIASVAKAANLDASVLTPKQRETLTQQLPFHVKDGKVSMEWQGLAKAMIEERLESKKTAEASEAAGKHNAGMDKGRQPSKVTPKAPVVPATPKPNERKKADWDGPLSGALEEMGITR